MNYAICSECREFYYSTGKKYEEEFGEVSALLILNGIDPKTVPIKGLCPLCNPKSVYYLYPPVVYSKSLTRFAVFIYRLIGYGGFLPSPTPMSVHLSRSKFYYTKHNRPRLFWRIPVWVCNRRFIQYKLDKIINLFTLPNKWTLKEKWDYWGGGGRINWWIRKHVTFN